MHTAFNVNTGENISPKEFSELYKSLPKRISNTNTLSNAICVTWENYLYFIIGNDDNFIIGFNLPSGCFINLCHLHNENMNKSIRIINKVNISY